MKKSILIVVVLLFSSGLSAQKLTTKENWFNLDYLQDDINGMSVERAYEELLKGRTSKTVIVGVVDSGVDILHEDLVDRIWVNEDEIPNNNIDDDKNGFVDDVNGWDFIGGPDGQDVAQEQLESARLMVKYDEFFGDNPKKRKIKKNKEAYNEYQQIKKEIAVKVQEAEQYLLMYKGLLENLTRSEDLLKDALDDDELDLEKVTAMNDAEVDLKVRQAKQYWLRLTEMGADTESIQEGINHFNGQIKYNYNTNLNVRDIVGDNPEKLQYAKYGNNEVRGPRAMHGTHVSGIIAANRNNDIGMKGVANDVRIMVVRTVPDGDERDKDVANAIRYAVDNGASIINMSFGKPYSPEKKWVDDAVKYAESKGVLMVAAAGNENENIDEHVHFPSKYYIGGGEASNWIGVGAISYKQGQYLPAEFSNYGKKGVDVFAPGVAIYSTTPDSKYSEQQGTSMAAPAVTGVAALVKSYFPMLTAVQLRKIILESSLNKIEQEVITPGGGDKVPFGTLSSTGGIVNAYNAIKMAIEMTEGGADTSQESN